ncbi:hypothetical protein JOB18_047102 [Solea senegalensis]|uniref:Uncharacterized protein n=1 Tax=Solea senegalensis TaxID=28829 RepID=A0AAV6S0Q2_SOLSE|nr:hypothetical protein JOB18_047102 [Solea senegalensis]
MAMCRLFGFHSLSQQQPPAATDEHYVGAQYSPGSGAEEISRFVEAQGGSCLRSTLPHLHI